MALKTRIPKDLFELLDLAVEDMRVGVRSRDFFQVQIGLTKLLNTVMNRLEVDNGNVGQWRGPDPQGPGAA